MAYLKNKQRNRLLSAHLNAAMRLFLQRQHTLATFPYPIAMQHWRSGAQKRGRYGMAGSSETSHLTVNWGQYITVT